MKHVIETNIVSVDFNAQSSDLSRPYKDKFLMSIMSTICSCVWKRAAESHRVLNVYILAGDKGPGTDNRLPANTF